MLGVVGREEATGIECSVVGLGMYWGQEQIRQVKINKSNTDIQILAKKQDNIIFFKVQKLQHKLLTCKQMISCQLDSVGGMIMKQ